MFAVLLISIKVVLAAFNVTLPLQTNEPMALLPGASLPLTVTLPPSVPVPP